MIIRLSFLLLLTNLDQISGRGGGGGRGGGTRAGGFGRGGGGARAGVGRGGGMGRIHGSSHYSSGFRSGSMGWKKGSASPANAYGSASFRSSLFSRPAQSSRPIFTSSLANMLVIASIARPITYDNRYYYWSSSYAQENLSPVEFPTLCEYKFGEDDGELQNVTFANGTHARALYFGCSEMADCCGMYCCHAIGEYIKLMLFLILLLSLIPLIIWCDRTKGPPQDNNKRDVPLVEISEASGSLNFNSTHLNVNEPMVRGPEKKEMKVETQKISIN